MHFISKHLWSYFFYKLHFGFNESAFGIKLLASAYLVWSCISTTSRRVNHNLDILSKRIVHVSQESKEKNHDFKILQ